MLMSEPTLVHLFQKLLSDGKAGGVTNDSVSVAVGTQGRGLIVRYIVGISEAGKIRQQEKQPHCFDRSVCSWLAGTVVACPFDESKLAKQLIHLWEINSRECSVLTMF